MLLSFYLKGPNGRLASVFVVGEVFPELLLVLVHLFLVLLEHPVDDEKGEK